MAYGQNQFGTAENNLQLHLSPFSFEFSSVHGSFDEGLNFQFGLKMFSIFMRC